MLRIEISQRSPKRVVIRASGALELESIDLLDPIVREVSARPGRVYLDLSDIVSADSAGIEYLAKLRGLRIHVVRSRGFVREWLKAALRSSRAVTALLVLLLMTIFSAVAYGQEEAITLDRALAMASENNLALRNAKLETEKSKERLTATRTRRLPALTIDTLGNELLTNLSFRFERGAFGTFPSTGPIPDRDTRVDVARTFNVFTIARLTQPVTQQRKIGLGIRLAEAELAVGRERERAARQSIVAEVKRAYFGVLAAESAVAATTEGVRLAEEVAREMDHRLAQGVVLEADRADARAHLASANAGALAASNALRTVSRQFNYLLGRDLDAPVRVVPIPMTGEVDASGTDVSARADVRESELRLQQARIDLQLKRADRIPDVSVAGMYVAPVSSELLPGNIASASVIVSYEPFTWGRRRAEINEKRNGIQQAENALEDHRRRAVIEIGDRAGRVAEAAANVAVRRLERESARERLRVAKNRFDRQAARLDELFAAEAQASRAAALEQEAITTYWTARADYDRAIGKE